jgi:ribonuclease D
VSPKKANSAAQNNESTSELIEDKKKLMALIDRAQDGDKDALPVLRKVLDEAPRIARFVDLARDVERSIVKRMSGDDVFTQEAILRNLKAMRKEIAGEGCSPLERLLAERITVCWLELQYFQALYAQNLDNLSITQSDYHQRRIDKAHRRYLSSIKALAQIRKMGPAVQINIAEQQINQAG